MNKENFEPQNSDEIYSQRSARQRMDQQFHLIDQPIAEMPMQTDINKTISHILKRIDIIQKMLPISVNEINNQTINNKKKKIRRKAKDIPKKYKCSFSSCGKFYGSRSSAKNHIKIKHKIAKQKVRFAAQSNGIIRAITGNAQQQTVHKKL